MKRDSKTIAILGATGHIARSIIYSFKDEPNFILHLFTRSVEKTKAFTQEIGLLNVPINTYDKFNDSDYSCIINCVGIGNPSRLKSNPDEVFFLTEEMDLFVIKHLRVHPQTTYINFSSGAIYGTEFSMSAQNNSNANIAINDLKLSDFYGIAKINSEAKHRSLHDLNIIDLRIFGFYSQFIELDRPYLLTEVINSIITDKTFITSNINIVRDYIHPSDLAELVKRCMEQKKMNTAFDIYSKEPISKFDMLDYFKSSYNFVYSIKQNSNIISVTGSKDNYFSDNKRLSLIGFEPRHTSLECISFITSAILKQYGFIK